MSIFNKQKIVQHHNILFVYLLSTYIQITYTSHLLLYDFHHMYNLYSRDFNRYALLQLGIE